MDDGITKDTGAGGLRVSSINFSSTKTNDPCDFYTLDSFYLTMKNLQSAVGRESCSFSGATERVDFQTATARDLSRSLSVNSRTRIKTPNVSGHMLARTIGSYGLRAANAPSSLNVYTLSRTRCGYCLIVVYIANHVPVDGTKETAVPLERLLRPVTNFSY